MRYGDARSFRMALEKRLKTGAGEDGARLSRERKYVVFDRLLARLAVTAFDRWLLKGGFALDLRLGERARATKDIDIDWQAAEEELLDALIDAAAHDAGDFFEFTVERAGEPDDRLGGSHRFRVAASLAGRPFETFLLDVGFRDATTEVDYLTTPGTLTFAGIEPVTVAATPLELHVAEKLHAYTRVYDGSRTSTRTKDLVDLALIAELSPLDAARLRSAIDEIFASRGTHPGPDRLPTPPEGWRLPFRQLAEAVGVPTETSEAHSHAAAVVDPILSGAIKQGTWDPDAPAWRDHA